MKKTARLRELLNSKDILVMPGGFSPVVGIIAERVGYQCLYMSGFGTAAFKMGMPDIGLMTMSEALENAKNMARAVSIPLISDADTGYGNALNIKRTVAEFEAAGVAGIQIEDQVWPKRCGHMEGKELISAEEMVQKIKSACDAKEDKDFVIIARTDANTVLGFAEAIRRSNMYAQAGADVIFFESPLSLAELEKIPRLVQAPVMVNMSEGAKTPLLTNVELQELGYKIALWPSSTTWAAAKAIENVLTELLAKGTTAGSLENMIAFHEFNKLLRLEDYVGLAAKYK